MGRLGGPTTTPIWGVVDSEPWWSYAVNPLFDPVWGTFDDGYINNIAVDRSGTLWATLEFWKLLDSGKGTEVRWFSLLSFNGTQWMVYDQPVFLILEERQGRVWMSCAGGLCVKDGSDWKRYDKVGTGDYTRWHVYSMTEDAVGRLWIREGNYFGVLEGTTWTGFPYEEFRAFGTPVIDSRGDLWIVSRDGLYRWHQSDLPTAIESSSMPGAPRSFHLAQNYPNPFNHATHIGFTLQQSSSVTLQVFNTHGQLVATLVEGTRPAGTYQTAWDGRDAQGQAVSSGVYIVRLDAGGQQALPQDATDAIKRDAYEMNRKFFK